MGKRYLIDSNTLIHFQAKTLPEKGQVFVGEIADTEFNISVINKIEVLGYADVTKSTEDFISLANVFDLDADIIKTTISLRKKHKIKIPDAIIAATSLAYNFTLVTGNTADFKSIKGLLLINPEKL